jgi:hypothetical protein
MEDYVAIRKGYEAEKEGIRKAIVDEVYAEYEAHKERLKNNFAVATVKDSSQFVIIGTSAFGGKIQYDKVTREVQPEVRHAILAYYKGPQNILVTEVAVGTFPVDARHRRFKVLSRRLAAITSTIAAGDRELEAEAAAAGLERKNAARIQDGFSSTGIVVRMLGSRNVFNSSARTTTADFLKYEFDPAAAGFFDNPRTASYIREGLHFTLSGEYPDTAWGVIYDSRKIFLRQAFKFDMAFKSGYVPVVEDEEREMRRAKGGHITDYADISKAARRKYGVSLQPNTMEGIAFKTARMPKSGNFVGGRKWQPHNEVLVRPQEGVSFMDAVIGIVTLPSVVAKNSHFLTEVKVAVDAVKPGLPVFAYDAESSTLHRVTELPGYAGALGGRKKRPSS